MKRLPHLLFLLAMLCPVASSAKSSAGPLRYALLSAVGDQITAVYARTQTGSRLDKNEREVAPLPDNSLDRMVLRSLDGALKQNAPNAEVAALAAANKSLFDVQRDVLIGRKSSDAAVSAFAAALPPGGADRLLLVLKHRAEARIPVDEGIIGVGRLEGVGFYVDRVTVLKSVKTRNQGTGFLAPFAYVRLVLADANGNVLAQKPLEAATSIGIGHAPDALQPWDVLDANDKARVLDALLKREIDRALPELLAAAGKR